MPFSMTGKQEMIDRFNRLKQNLPPLVAMALRIETEIEATEVRKRTPVWNPSRMAYKGLVKGALRASVRVDGPYIEGGFIFTQILAGGSMAPYALYVHEDLEAFHATGQAKFIESVILESRPFMASRVAKRIELNKAI